MSDAETMLRYLNPEAKPTPDILLLTKPGCSHCARAKGALQELGLGYEAVDVSARAVRAVSETHATPRVFVDGKLIGGADELVAWLSARES